MLKEAVAFSKEFFGPSNEQDDSRNTLDGLPEAHGGCSKEPGQLPKASDGWLNELQALFKELPGGFNE